MEDKPHKPREAAKETFESIVVALILAFVFRAFIVEAFVIPTGSMAPTLYGAHGTILCRDCGTEFAYGLRDLADMRQTTAVTHNAFAYCPNCRFGNTKLKINDAALNPEPGDRILVLKWPYDLGIPSLGPQRWDVTVFKDPSDGTTNFIKRLVGLPGEALMIVDGDVYAAPLSMLKPETVEAMDQLRKDKFRLRTGQARGRLRPTPRHVLADLDKNARIVRKTDVAQESLWLTAYDHDRPPAVSRSTQPRWESSQQPSSWNTLKRRFRFKKIGQDTESLILNGQALRATCAYNVGLSNAPRPRKDNDRMPPFVQDQRVRFVLTPLTEDGAAGISLTKHGREFHATVQFDGKVSIYELPGEADGMPPVRLSATTNKLVTGKPVTVSFENLDYRLRLFVDGQLALQTKDDREADGYYGPNLSKLRRGVSRTPARPAVLGIDGEFEVSHLAVHRDVYYFLDQGMPSSPWPTTGWGSQLDPIMLRDGEYFMLGDNTAASKDSRLWDVLSPYLQTRGEEVQLGTVPRDQLIGRAFFVYWPSMQRVDWLEWIPKVSRWGVVPDVGRMRWIR